ncbi:acyl-CoA-like ligand-binding transcription factor [Gorillibacterium timonense]|uniref:acyl-CoA-like ligand-binding transcription factor n=1 Tax=Gorillibacterium timonense TaxID=1689269 RepID=UPI000A68E8AE|nr:TetR family transcriptional regulator [Gorillibacterium timonense]
MPDGNQSKIGLRERKKMKTKATIQRNALRLFREQGYQATTVEQIAEVSEISPSTFFRYFATKEAVVLEDDFDPLLIETYCKQPRELSPIEAFRKALREGFSQIPEEERIELWDRISLSMSIPELRASMLQQVTDAADLIATIIGERQGCDAADLKVRTLAGAFVSVLLSAQAHYLQHPEREFVDIADEALALMEAGFPL